MPNLRVESWYYVHDMWTRSFVMTTASINEKSQLSLDSAAVRLLHSGSKYEGLPQQRWDPCQSMVWLCISDRSKQAVDSSAL